MPDGLALMADFVTGHEGPVLVASHDRAFLDRVATRVVELDLAQQRVGHYAGGWSDYAAARDLARRQAREASRSTPGRATSSSRSRPAGGLGGQGAPQRGHRRRARQAHPREVQGPRGPAGRQGGRIRKAADRLEAVAQPRKEWELRYSIAAGPASADVVGTLDRVEVGRGDFHLGPLDLTVARGDRLARPATTAPASPPCSAPCSATCRSAAGSPLGSRVAIGVVDQRRRAARDRPARSSTW